MTGRPFYQNNKSRPAYIDELDLTLSSGLWDKGLDLESVVLSEKPSIQWTRLTEQKIPGHHEIYIASLMEDVMEDVMEEELLNGLKKYRDYCKNTENCSRCRIKHYALWKFCCEYLTNTNRRINPEDWRFDDDEDNES